VTGTRCLTLIASMSVFLFDESLKATNSQHACIFMIHLLNILV
jgi:hypothetical protein